jgi:hypothetical protein
MVRTLTLLRLLSGTWYVFCAASFDQSLDLAGRQVLPADNGGNELVAEIGDL